MNVPPILNEALITRFKYWENGIKEGMNYRGQLYQFSQFFAAGDRLKAYQSGCQLCEGGLSAVITAEAKGYSLWVSLRSPLCPFMSEGKKRDSYGVSSSQIKDSVDSGQWTVDSGQ